MQAWIDFGQGPLFRLCFALMVLGLLRIFILTVIGMVEAYYKNEDRIIPFGELIQKTFSWMVPVTRVWSKRPIYGVVSVLFHIGLILVPLFYAAHVLLWKNSVGFSWFKLPQGLADVLAINVIIGGIILFLMRALYKPAHALSRKQDYIWPLLLAVPFLTGYICAHNGLSPSTYQWIMFFHIYSANLIMVMIPFTKVAHCVLLPLSQLVTGISWKFPFGAGDKVIETLGYKDRPSWVVNPRLESAYEAVPEIVTEKEVVAE